MNTLNSCWKRRKKGVLLPLTVSDPKARVTFGQNLVCIKTRRINLTTIFSIPWPLSQGLLRLVTIQKCTYILSHSAEFFELNELCTLSFGNNTRFAIISFCGL